MEKMEKYEVLQRCSILDANSQTKVSPYNAQSSKHCGSHAGTLMCYKSVFDMNVVVKDKPFLACFRRY